LFDDFNQDGVFAHCEVFSKEDGKRLVEACMGQKDRGGVITCRPPRANLIAMSFPKRGV
jgi:hypothetical protein